MWWLLRTRPKSTGERGQLLRCRSEVVDVLRTLHPEGSVLSGGRTTPFVPWSVRQVVRSEDCRTPFAPTKERRPWSHCTVSIARTSGSEKGIDIEVLNLAARQTNGLKELRHLPPEAAPKNIERRDSSANRRIAQHVAQYVNIITTGAPGSPAALNQLHRCTVCL
jgi:hypothetical protein